MESQFGAEERDYVLLEWLLNIRKLLAEKDLNSEVCRRLSHYLRELLLEQRLNQCAKSNGIVDLKICTRNVRHIFYLRNQIELDYFQFGFPEDGFINTRNILMFKKADELKLREMEERHNAYNQIFLNAHSFLKQPVIIFRGEPITRSDVIKFVANKAGGVHFDLKERSDLVESVRSSIKVSQDESGKLNFSVDGRISTDKKHEFIFEFNPDHIDPIFLEVVAAAEFVANSPDVKKLIGVLAGKFNREKINV